MMLENENIPKIRFKGFAEPWEKRKLKDIADKVIEKNADLVVQETFTNSAEFGIISQRDFFDHDISNAENIDGYYVVKDEDFVYNPRISVTAPVGPINRNKLGRNGVMSPLYTVFHTHDIDTTYLEWFFKSSYWHSFMHYNGDSGARSDRFSIKDAVFFEMPIPYPSLEEQREIGIWMSQLDKIITLHQRKYEKLKQIKKSMLEKMFPHEGKDVPEIRFKEFTEPWERRKLKDMVLYVSSNLTAKDALEKGLYDLYDANSIIGKTNTIPIPSEYISIIKDGAGVGRIRLMPKNTLFIGTMGGLIADRANLRFVYSLLNRFNLGDEFSGSTIPHIYFKDYGNNEYYIPCLKEQKLIGSYFTNLDKLIILHKRKYEKLEQIKKSLLEKMFAQ